VAHCQRRIVTLIRSALAIVGTSRPQDIGRDLAIGIDDRLNVETGLPSQIVDAPARVHDVEL
jgi:hypothetical protein